MYGWRARIGYLSSRTREVAGGEMFKAAPDGGGGLHGNLFFWGDKLDEI